MRSKADIGELPDMVKASALERIATFKDFNEENDPHEKHDYGSFDHCDREFWFKIDYFDLKLESRRSRQDQTDHDHRPRAGLVKLRPLNPGAFFLPAPL
jgi:hypothetical protein